MCVRERGAEESKLDKVGAERCIGDMKWRCGVGYGVVRVDVGM